MSQVDTFTGDLEAAGVRRSHDGRLHVPPPVLERVGIAILRGMGCLPAEAEEVAAHLVESNLRGHDSHGIGMLPTYVRNHREGFLHPNRHVRVVSRSGPFVTMEGDGGFGQVIGREATDHGIEIARAEGIAIVGLRNVQHLGRIGTYGERAVRAGLMSISFVNVRSGVPYVAPFGGTDGRLGTNPVCIAMPSGSDRPPIVLDFATSVVAYGKVRVAHNERKRLRVGDLISSEGELTDDPAVLVPDRKGAIMPMGEHKGYGLAVICDLLAGALVGNGTYADPNRPIEGIANGMLSFIFDPARVGDLSMFATEAANLIDFLKASPSRDSDNPVLIAGEPELASKEKRTRQGIPVDAITWGELVTAAREVGAPGPLVAQECKRRRHGSNDGVFSRPESSS